MSPVKFEAVACPLCECTETYPLLEWWDKRMVCCHVCGLVYQNPRPTASDIHGAYTADGTDLELEEQVGRHRNHQFRRVLNSFPDGSGRLLDVGCGYGFFLKIAHERGWNAIGVDLNPKGIEYAKERLQVNALLGDIKDINFPDGSFDLVTLWNVVDFVPNPLDFLSEIRRVLKEDGYLFIRTPNFAWQYLSFRLAKFLKHLGWRDLFDERPYATFIFHLTNFSRPTLRLLFDRTGFIPLHISNSPPIPGDPYLGLGPKEELLLRLGKRAVHAVAQGLALLSGDRWLIGPSLEAWGQPGKIHKAA